MSDPERAFYTRDGDAIIPTGLGVSSWDKTKQGGAPIAGLVAQLLRDVPTQVPMLPARLTIDLLGAVPMAPMLPRARLLRDGKRIQTSALEIEVEGRTAISATLLRVRTEGEVQPNEPLLRPFPEGQEGVRRTIAESIRLEGSESEPGPGAVWMRVITSMIAGEPSDPLANVAAAADWGTAVAPPADPREWTYANLDLSINLSRLPTSDWMLLEGRSEVAGNGLGYADMRMGDLSGMFGSVHQSVFLARRKR